ncbi:MAG TPA: pyridoxamine 5'-phosphate oxidase family protein [Catenuloplanes sp.]|jgi:PPOX class probable F420-dependent enzyme
MSAEAATAMLAECRKVQLATINPDGTPHLVTMFYVLREGRIAFWTYRAAQKARNLDRDPRLTCLVEDGEDYFELRGVQVRGVARRLDDPAEVAGIGRSIAARLTGVPVDTVADYVTQAARKRVAYVVEPTRVTSWDHRQLVT